MPERQELAQFAFGQLFWATYHIAGSCNMQLQQQQPLAAVWQSPCLPRATKTVAEPQTEAEV